MRLYESEITIRTSRSGGSGGQNVNKVETKVEILWNPATSALVSEAERVILLEKLKLTADGFLQIVSQEDRTQVQNRTNALKKLHQTVEKALIVPQKRKPTAIPRAVKEAIKKEKAVNAVKKQNRKRPNVNEED
jgi:ribosome-associated protein